MLDFDERTLFQLAEQVGFSAVTLTLEATSGVRPETWKWDQWMKTSPNPLAPTGAEAVASALSPDEADRFAAYMRPLMESTPPTFRSARVPARGQVTARDKPVRAAFFDLGGTLVDAPPGDDPWRPLVMARIEREFGALPWADELYAADIRRPPADDPYRQETNRWFEDWLKEHGEAWEAAKIERLRLAFAAPLPEVFSLSPGAETALRWSKAHGLVVVVLTNTTSRGDAEVWGDCRRLGLEGLVDEVVSSYSTGWSKPHPAMFERALEFAGVDKRAAFMVGDQFHEDVAGAKQLGLRAVWKRRRETPEPDGHERPDAVIRSLAELPAVAQAWL